MTAVGIFVRSDLGEAGPAVRGLVDWLARRDHHTLLEERTAALVGITAHDGVEVLTAEGVGGRADAVVVLGGDGTLLAASHVIDRPVPVLGVNFGSLGFLTEITLPELYPTLESVLAGTHRGEERSLLRVLVEPLHGEPSEVHVLNDVVITKAALSRIIELDVSVDGSFVSTIRADGLIVSSPTGSTAYNLAAGGPVLHPSLGAIALTPICPHMLSYRPLVVRDDCALEVKLSVARDRDVYITFDGQRGFHLEPGDRVHITRSSRRLHLVKSPERDYFEVLRTKLKWGESSRRRG